MDPVLFAFELPIIGKVTFPAYFTLLTIGFAFATLLTWRDAKQLKIDPDRIIDLNLYMVIFGVLGARVLHVIADGHFMDYVNMCIAPETIHAEGNVPASCTTDAQCGDYFLCNTAAGHCHPPRDCLIAFKIWRGGLAYYGGFLGAVAFGLYYIRKHRLPMWRVTDLAAYAIPMGLFWGRMGCFLNGCCFGKVTHSAWGVVFPKGGAAWRMHRDQGLLPHPTAAALPVHPTQLYSALANLAIFALLYFGLRPRKRFDGQVFWWFGILYAISRAVTEIWRDDERGVVLGFISTSQIISVPWLALSFYMLHRLKRASLPQPAAAEPAPEQAKATDVPDADPDR
jgi:phosphatidylglycerol:prolipoprotein diacylglycerol transferase